MAVLGRLSATSEGLVPNAPRAGCGGSGLDSLGGPGGGGRRSGARPAARNVVFRDAERASHRLLPVLTAWRDRPPDRAVNPVPPRAPTCVATGRRDAGLR